MDRRACLVVFIVLLFAMICPVYAGAVFDDILNAMQIDQQLVRSGDDYHVLTPGKPLGQTFVVGESVEQLCRIAVRASFWDADWKPDESLVLTLWDSPDKKTKISSFSIPHKQRHWIDGMLMFSLETKVEPKRQYYFELTVDASGEKKIAVLLSRKDRVYDAGCAYENGKASERDVWFETHVKKTANREANLQAFYNNFNLDYPGLEKVKAAVGAKDWESAQREFLTYFESKEDLLNDNDATPKLDPSYDTKEADLIVQQKWSAVDGPVIDLGPNWNYFASWPNRGGVGLTRTGIMKPLAFTYTKTGDEKYARAWNDMLISLFRNVPSPEKSGALPTTGRLRHTVPAGISGGMWDAISISARLHQETFYNRFRKSPLFEQDTRMAWWANMVDMANFLERMDTGGNWTTQVTSSFFGLGQKYPEMKKAKGWFQLGFDGIKKNFEDNMYPDGPCKEATTNYHGFSLGMFFGTFKQAKNLGLEVPQNYWDRIEKAYEYNMYITQTDWQTPVWGDTNRPMDSAGLVMTGAEYFHRDDMRWVATHGKEGVKPAKTSVAYPTAGYYVMRSGWTPQDKFLMTRNGLSYGHEHSDQLSMIVNAYGTDLLPDPGVYIYGSPEMGQLVKTTSHTTISVDGKDIINGEGVNTWTTLPGYDYFCGTSPGYEGLTDVKHERAILFVKPDYWVVADWVRGTGEYTATQSWRFAPGKVNIDSASGVVQTANTKGGNIAIIPLYPQGRSNELTKGVYALGWDGIERNAPIARYERKGTLPMAFCTVMFPYPANKAFSAKVNELLCDDLSLNTSVLGNCVSYDSSVDYIVFNKSGKEISIDSGKLKTNAESAMIRTVAKSGKITAFTMQAGSSLAFGSTVLVTSDAPVKGLSVSYKDGTLTVDTDGQATLSIATLDAKSTIINGKVMKIPSSVKMLKLGK